MDEVTNERSNKVDEEKSDTSNGDNDKVMNERSNKKDEEKSDTSNGDIDKVMNERSNKKDEKESNCVITAFPSCLRWRQLSTDQQLQLLSDVKDRELEAYGKRREISGKHAYLTTEILHSDITMKILVSAKDLPRSDGFLSSSDPDPYFQIYDGNRNPNPRSYLPSDNPNKNATILYVCSSAKRENF